jgi:hypothetical protein
MTQKMPVKLNSRRFAPGYPQAHSSSSQPHPNPHFPQFQSNPSFTSPQPSPPFSPPMPTVSPFQPINTPTSPAYLPQAILPPPPAQYLDPTVVRIFFFWLIRNRPMSSAKSHSRFINKSRLRATSITCPRARMAPDVGLRITIFSLPMNWPTFARTQRNILALPVLGVCVSTDLLLQNYQADMPVNLQVSIANSATIVAWVIYALAGLTAHS